MLQSQHDEALTSVRQARDEQIRSLQEHVNKLQESLVESKQRAAASTGQPDIQAFQKRIEELEQQLSQSQTSGENAEQAKSELRSKSKKSQPPPNT